MNVEKFIPDGHKVCSQCTERKHNNDFYWQNRDGVYKSMSECKECCKKNNAKRKLKPDYVIKLHQQRLDRIERRKNDFEFRERECVNRRNSYHNNKHKSMWYAARYRAKRNSMDFNIDLEDVIIPIYCPILGVKLERGTESVYENSPSLDRIDNTKGYIKGNVLVMSKKANSMKNSATLPELKLFCQKMLELIATYDIVQTEEDSKPSELEDKEPLG